MGGSGGSGGGTGVPDAGMDGGFDLPDGGCVAGTHNSCGLGVCRAVIPMCVPDSDTTTCMPGAPAVKETCNGLDDDCNGRTDDGDQTCGVGACQRTVPACMGGAPAACVPGASTAEVCNGIDDDCDGTAEQGKWLKDTFAVGAHLDLAFACMTQNAGSTIGDITIGDQGGVNCMTTSCGRLDGKCDAKDIPAQLPVTITSFTAPTAVDAGVVRVGLGLQFTANRLFVATASSNPSVCLGLGSIHCSFRFDSTFAQPATSTATLVVAFAGDAGFPRLVDLKLSSATGTQTCGASGAPPVPECLSPTDLLTTGESTCGNMTCTSTYADPMRAFIVSALGTLLQQRFKTAVEQQTCEPCGTGLKPCPP